MCMGRVTGWVNVREDPPADGKGHGQDQDHEEDHLRHEEHEDLNKAESA